MASAIIPPVIYDPQSGDIETFIEVADHFIRHGDFHSAIDSIKKMRLLDEEIYTHYASQLAGRLFQDCFDIRLPRDNTCIEALILMQDIPACSGLLELLGGFLLGIKDSKNSDKDF